MARILPLVRYFAYVETGQGEEERFGSAQGLETSLWSTYRAIAGDGTGPLAMRRLSELRDVWGVFADLFRKDATGPPVRGGRR